MRAGRFLRFGSPSAPIFHRCRGISPGQFSKGLVKTGGTIPWDGRFPHRHSRTSLTTAQRKLRGINAAQADIAVRIRRTIVQVSCEQSCVRRLVPVAAAKNGVAPRIPSGS